jgi:restriction system protein
MDSTLPSYGELMLPVVRAVLELGGSGTSREISESVIEAEGFSEDLLAVTYDGREKSILVDRLDWARSYCKLGGVLESPKRGLFLITDLGREVAALPDLEANERLKEVDHAVRRARRKKPKGDPLASEGEDVDSPPEDDERWREVLLARLHGLSPDAFEHFALYVLRSQGMELKRVGGSGDEGIDGIGKAPLSGVLSTTIAVQAKRYDPSKTVGRETVALFQSDATAAGAEHGVLVTTGRFSEPARQAASGRHPTIDLVDGEKLTELCLEANIGVALSPVVNEAFFDRFEDLS